MGPATRHQLLSPPVQTEVDHPRLLKQWPSHVGRKGLAAAVPCLDAAEDEIPIEITPTVLRASVALPMGDKNLYNSGS